MVDRGGGGPGGVRRTSVSPPQQGAGPTFDAWQPTRHSWQATRPRGRRQRGWSRERPARHSLLPPVMPFWAPPTRGSARSRATQARQLGRRGRRARARTAAPAGPARDRERALLVPGRRPHAQRSAEAAHGVGEDEGALLGQVERASPWRRARRTAPAGRRAARRRAGPARARCAGCVAPEELRAERARAVPAHEEVHVAHVVGLHDHDRVGLQRLDAPPGLRGARRRRERVLEGRGRRLTARRTRRPRAPGRCPLPVGVGLAPQPQPVGHVAYLDRHGRRG